MMSVSIGGRLGVMGYLFVNCVRERRLVPKDLEIFSIGRLYMKAVYGRHGEPKFTEDGWFETLVLARIISQPSSSPTNTTDGR